MMIYLFYVETQEDEVQIRRCRDEMHYRHLMMEIETQGKITPLDLRWHGSETHPPMRVLAVSNRSNLKERTPIIIERCTAWLRQN